MKKRKILFLGESYRADAITWMKGLKEFGDFEICTWELQTPNNSKLNRFKRILEYAFSPISIRKTIKEQKPDMIIAERTTSYGFLAAISGMHPVAIAQQGRTDLWPEGSVLLPFKKIIQKHAFKKADLIHAWGPVMTISMKEIGVDMSKVLVIPKGIDLSLFSPSVNNSNKIEAIVTRSLQPEYRHDSILKAFAILHQKGIDFSLTIVGDGTRLQFLKDLAAALQIENKVIFTGRIPNTELPKLLQQSNIYISMPITEGVSASLFEAMACSCYPVVSDIAGNQSWIKHRENGQLITIDNIEMLAEELIWSFENVESRNNAILQNRKFVEENANYNINMKIIANKYHELLDLNYSAKKNTTIVDNTSIKNNNYTSISSIDFINNLNFEYVETYSFQRGEEFEKNNLLAINEYKQLEKRKLKKNDLSEFEKLRFNELDQLVKRQQYLVDNKGEFHPSSKRINTFKFTSPQVTNLKNILNTKIVDIPTWMCAPKYRDAIVFYDKNDKILKVLNICLSCQHMASEPFASINADSSTYDLLKRFFIEIKHDVEE